MKMEKNEQTSKEKIKISYPIIVEGKYDRLRLLDVADAWILTTDGFGIFNQKEKRALLQALAAKTPVILLTDSDGAGKLIRSHLTGCLPRDRVIQLYIPKIPGKEKRKATLSAEGTLGVEGMEKALLTTLLSPYEDGAAPRPENTLCKADFYRDGLSGHPDCAERRNALAAQFRLPPDMTANALLAALRMIGTYEEYQKAVAALDEKKEDMPR